MLKFKRDKGATLKCTKCGKAHEFDLRHTFGVVQQWLKDNGWRVRNEHGTWLHYCPTCVARLDSKVEADRASVARRWALAS